MNQASVQVAARRFRAFRGRVRGFTLVELLVVISIIALLLGILLPSLNRALQTAKGTQCISQMRQFMTANTMYAGEYDGFLPFCNSDTMEAKTPIQWAGPGWLYDYSKDNARNKPEDVEDGVLWPYMKSRKIYRCPMDKGSWTGVQNMTSYIMSSVTRGFDAFVKPSVQLAKFNSDSMLMWEGDETNQSGGAWNDGNNDPDTEIISSRHDNGGSTGFADSHVEHVPFQQYVAWKNALSGANPLWCNPLASDGRFVNK